jgi:hypothetical protein
MVNLPTQQLSPVPRTNALFFGRGIIAVHLAFRRVACFSLPISLQSHRRRLINTWSPANQHLVRPHLQVVCCHRQSYLDQNGPTSNQTNRHHLNQVDSIARVYINPGHCPCIRWNHCIWWNAIASTPPALQSLAKSIPTKPQLR